MDSSTRWGFSRRCRRGRISVSAAGYSQLEVRKVSYRPPGTEQNLLNEINLSLREKSFGLLFGRSGSGKTTLLQLLAGLSEPTHGMICIQKYNDSGIPVGSSELLTAQRVENHNLQVQTPDLLLLDEPLAGLDWKARADVVNLLKDLKKDHTILAIFAWARLRCCLPVFLMGRPELHCVRTQGQGCGKECRVHMKTCIIWNAEQDDTEDAADIYPEGELADCATVTKHWEVCSTA
uniref:AAA+ ATPase domain-containing protein n=1 Tax=Leersia perrieri TaxID=77586 RepID=A0A0D9XS69_9ORYZ